MIFHRATELNPRGLRLCGNKVFCAISPQNVFQNIVPLCRRMTKVLKIDLESNKEEKKKI